MLQTKNVFHVNGVDLREVPFLPQQDSNSTVQDVPSTLPHHLGKGGSPSHSAVLQEKKQHNGLRCKKCFELLVHDDEFMYEVYLCFSVAMPTGSYTRTLPF